MSAWHVRPRWVPDDDPYYDPVGDLSWRSYRPDWSRMRSSVVGEGTIRRDLDALHDTVRRALGGRPIGAAAAAVDRAESRLMERLRDAVANTDAGASALEERTGHLVASNIAMQALAGRVGHPNARDPDVLVAVREMAGARRAHALAARDAALRAAEDRIRAIAAARALEAGATGLPRISRATRDA